MRSWPGVSGPISGFVLSFRQDLGKLSGSAIKQLLAEEQTAAREFETLSESRLVGRSEERRVGKECRL